MSSPQGAPESTVSFAAYEEEISSLAARARALVDGIDAQAFNFSPRPGAWSIGQCLDHLSFTHGLYAANLTRSIENAEPAGSESIGKRFGWFERWFVRNLEPPPRSRFKAPKKVHPRSEQDLDTVPSGYLQGLETTLGLRRQAEGLDFHRVRITSPFASFLRFRLGAAFAIIAAHDRRHIWQAEQVAASEGFPG